MDSKYNSYNPNIVHGILFYAEKEGFRCDLIFLLDRPIVINGEQLSLQVRIGAQNIYTKTWNAHRAERGARIAIGCPFAALAILLDSPPSRKISSAAESNLIASDEIPSTFSTLDFFNIHTTRPKEKTVMSAGTSSLFLSSYVHLCSSYSDTLTGSALAV